MVNKQYNVQNLNKNKTKNLNQIDAQTLNSSITVIPNDTNESYQSQNAFERNITQQFYHSLNDSLDEHFDIKHSMDGDDSMADIVKNNITRDATDSDSQSQKHLSINDIGRFQYILQMDREMVSSKRIHTHSLRKEPIFPITCSHIILLAG